MSGIEYTEDDVERVYRVLEAHGGEMTVTDIVRAMKGRTGVPNPKVQACLRWLDFQGRIVTTPPSRRINGYGLPETPRTYRAIRVLNGGWPG